MANSYNTNPIVLDTVMAATYKNTVGANLKGRFRISAIHWNATRAATTDVCQLNDGQGNPFYYETAPSSGFYPLHHPLLLDDFQLVALTEGQLFLYLLPGNV